MSNDSRFIHNKGDLHPKAYRSKGQKDKSRFLRHIYNSKKWKTLRKEYIEAYPLCECCGRPATQVHHRKPFSRGKSHKEIEHLAYDWHNLMAVCAYCHKGKHKNNET